MTEPTTQPAEPQPSPTAPKATAPAPKSSGDQLGNILIGSAAVMAIALALAFLYVATRDDDNVSNRRDAELEFVQRRDDDDWARTTYIDDDPEECDYEDDDGDAESRFADDARCVPEGGGLFPDEVPRENLSDEFIDFGRLERPTLRADLADRGSSRLREVEVSLGRGRGDIDIAVRNPGPMRAHGNGVAVRTENAAVLLSNTRFTTIRRPDDCRNGCDFTIWLTMGPSFQDIYPDAELMLYAGDDADAWIEEISRLPRQVYR